MTRYVSTASAERRGASTPVGTRRLGDYSTDRRVLVLSAAAVLIGLLGALAQGGIYGNVHFATGLWLAIPAVGGVLLGTALQQRISERAVSLLFALLLVVIAIELIVP